MTGVAASAIAIVLGIAIFIILAYKGLSPILASLVAAVIIGCTCEGGPLNAVFNTFMPQAVNFMSSVLLLIVIGGLLSAVLETTGTTDSLANGIIRLLGEKSIPIVVFVMTGLLCFLGVGSYQFIVAPLALGLLKKANISRNIGLVAMLVGANAVTYCLPGTSVTPNLMPTTILGTNIYAGAGVGIVAFLLATVLGLVYVYWMMRVYQKQGVLFEQDAAAAAGGPPAKQRDADKMPPFWTAIVTIVLLFGLCFLFSMVPAFGFDAGRGHGPAAGCLVGVCGKLQVHESGYHSEGHLSRHPGGNPACGHVGLHLRLWCRGSEHRRLRRTAQWSDLAEHEPLPAHLPGRGAAGWLYGKRYWRSCDGTQRTVSYPVCCQREYGSCPPHRYRHRLNPGLFAPQYQRVRLYASLWYEPQDQL